MTEANTVLSDEQIAEIEVRANTATEGPWSVWDSCSWRRIGTTEPFRDGTVICPITQNDGHPDLLARREDLEFVAHAREDVPALCATVKALRAQLGQAETDRREALHAGLDRLAEIEKLQSRLSQVERERERLATVSGEWAGLLDRIRAWSKCEDGYPLDGHINNITVEYERLKTSRRVHELDNHHNALACGYCVGPLKNELERLKKLEALKMNNEAPEQLFVQMVGDAHVSHRMDPREVHDNGKPVFIYRRVDPPVAPTKDLRIYDRDGQVVTQGAFNAFQSQFDSLKEDADLYAEDTNRLRAELGSIYARALRVERGLSVKELAEAALASLEKINTALLATLGREGVAESVGNARRFLDRLLYEIAPLTSAPSELDDIRCECGDSFAEHRKPTVGTPWDICSFPCLKCKCQEFTEVNQ